MDPAINNKNGTLKAICGLTTSKIGNSCSVAALASNIYMFGGYHNSQETSDVLFFNTRSIADTMNRMPHMLSNKCRPTKVSTHGKICV